MARPAAPPARELILERSIPEPNSGCWLWTHAKFPQGYGQVFIERRGVRAHRVSYETFVGSIPDGADILHKCGVRSCVNPAHLYPGTDLDNARDRDRHGRTPRGNEHWEGKRMTCKWGHVFDGISRGQRTCSTCAKARMARWLQKQVAVALAVLCVFASVSVASAGQNILSWTDNSSNEQNFNIERKAEACAGGAAFAPLATVGLDIVTFTDLAVTEGTTYCYRVNASNVAGASAFSNTAARTVPFSV